MGTAFITAPYGKSLENISVTLLPPPIGKKIYYRFLLEKLNPLFLFVFNIFNHNVVKIFKNFIAKLFQIIMKYIVKLLN